MFTVIYHGKPYSELTDEEKIECDKIYREEYERELAERHGPRQQRKRETTIMQTQSHVSINAAGQTCYLGKTWTELTPAEKMRLREIDRPLYNKLFQESGQAVFGNSNEAFRPGAE